MPPAFSGPDKRGVRAGAKAGRGTDEGVGTRFRHHTSLRNRSLRHRRGRGDVYKRQLLRTFGYSREDIERIIVPMCTGGAEPVGSMGNDTPLAVLSARPQILYNYFRQQFAQVTNPPIDPIREERCV